MTDPSEAFSRGMNSLIIKEINVDKSQKLTKDEERDRDQVVSRIRDCFKCEATDKFGDVSPTLGKLEEERLKEGMNESFNSL